MNAGHACSSGEVGRGVGVGGGGSEVSATRRWFELIGRKEDATGDKNFSIGGVEHEVGGRAGCELVDEGVVRSGGDIEAWDGERGGPGSPRLC